MMGMSLNSWEFLLHHCAKDRLCNMLLLCHVFHPNYGTFLNKAAYSTLNFTKKTTKVHIELHWKVAFFTYSV